MRLETSGWLLRAASIAAVFLSLSCAPRFGAEPEEPLPTGAPAGSLAIGGVEERCDGEDYIRWLEERSLLHQAEEAVRTFGESRAEWRHPYAEPRPAAVVKEGSVWVLGYPGSVITRPGQSVIATWADPSLWDCFREIGIRVLHTGPVKTAGGIRGRQYTPSVDGWFDRISLEIDPQLGTEGDYRRMVEVAREHDGSIAGDLVPLHTGKGADFLLALRAYKEYPGMYVMAEIDARDWELLPPVESPWDSVAVPRDVAAILAAKGYIPGIINSNDATTGAPKLSGWDATGTIRGADGKPRRWVYLHFFKPGQPALDWLHPSMAAQRVEAGDIIRTIHALGARGLRLDAVPFLGIEPRPGDPLTWHYLHPLSIWGTDFLAFLVRKHGGWTFHELNVPLQSLKLFTRNGSDLSYDFFTRTQILHALLMGDATLVRQAYRFLKEEGIELFSLVHDMQNHDEITYQLVELEHRADRTFLVRGEQITGRKLRERTLEEMRARAAGPSAPYNRLYRPQRDGVATTFAGFVAAGLGIADPYRSTPDQKERILRGHLLLAMANAMQPGVFSLSSWDLVGALPLPVESVADRLGDQDYRWINRGAVDLLGENPGAARSAYGLPRATALYGPLPEQLRNPGSFASHLARMLRARDRYGIPLGKFLAVPEVENPSLFVLQLELQDRTSYAVTALNFGRDPVRESIDLSPIEKQCASSLSGREVIEATSGRTEGRIGEDGRFPVELEPLSGKTLILRLEGRSP